MGVQGGAQPSPEAVEVDQLVELSVALANRRYDLGLTSDDIDDCAGLGHRHVQKVEDAGRNLGESRTISSDVVMALLTQVLEEGLTEDNVLRMSSMVATRSGIEGKRPPRPRIPTVDTLLLIVQALGGRLLIDWGEPPRLTRRLMDNSKR
ncbi:hypothetical protein DSW25_06210 [Sulfitobacter donghicola DSW-25 = KCTC 12864 = JCM 14565]|uniref:Uncharacterized protein n=1 Tax=Sulfitobacter donghicola DSW-25 = KCTC 12864 = JCM 14565 TaxID=1300350 RepID=A0A073ILB9_9RHOB|nr:hypothetical protein DSW25_06210 [Sulfitobacter donghicola DSW-25 = KCTC 12864 = JCM 14565]